MTIKSVYFQREKSCLRAMPVFCETHAAGLSTNRTRALIVYSPYVTRYKRLEFTFHYFQIVRLITPYTTRDLHQFAIVG